MRAIKEKFTAKLGSSSIGFLLQRESFHESKVPRKFFKFRKNIISVHKVEPARDGGVPVTSRVTTSRQVPLANDTSSTLT